MRIHLALALRVAVGRKHSQLTMRGDGTDVCFVLLYVAYVCMQTKKNTHKDKDEET
jgi:hypothetical protein